VIGALPGFAAMNVLGEALHAPLQPGQVLWDTGENSPECP